MKELTADKMLQGLKDGTAMRMTSTIADSIPSSFNSVSIEIDDNVGSKKSSKSKNEQTKTISPASEANFKPVETKVPSKSTNLVATPKSESTTAKAGNLTTVTVEPTLSKEKTSKKPQSEEDKAKTASGGVKSISISSKKTEAIDTLAAAEVSVVQPKSSEATKSSPVTENKLGSSKVEAKASTKSTEPVAAVAKTEVPKVKSIKTTVSTSEKSTDAKSTEDPGKSSTNESVKNDLESVKSSKVEVKAKSNDVKQVVVEAVGTKSEQATKFSTKKSIPASKDLLIEQKINTPGAPVIETATDSSSKSNAKSEKQMQTSTIVLEEKPVKELIAAPKNEEVMSKTEKKTFYQGWTPHFMTLKP